jgi:hypothetical protein
MSRPDYCDRHAYLHQQGGCPFCEVEICGSLGTRISKLQDKLNNIEKLLEEKVESREPKVIEKEKKSELERLLREHFSKAYQGDCKDISNQIRQMAIKKIEELHWTSMNKEDIKKALSEM